MLDINQELATLTTILTNLLLVRHRQRMPKDNYVYWRLTNLPARENYRVVSELDDIGIVRMGARVRRFPRKNSTVYPDFLLNMTKSNVKHELDLPLVLLVVSPFSELHMMTAFGLHILLPQTFAVNLINHQISHILKRRDYNDDATGCT
jgi:hypothetical protein